MKLARAFRRITAGRLTRRPQASARRRATIVPPVNWRALGWVAVPIPVPVAIPVPIEDRSACPSDRAGFAPRSHR